MFIQNYHWSNQIYPTNCQSNSTQLCKMILNFPTCFESTQTIPTTRVLLKYWVEDLKKRTTLFNFNINCALEVSLAIRICKRFMAVSPNFNQTLIFFYTNVQSESSPNRRFFIPILSLNQSELLPFNVVLFGTTKSHSVSTFYKRRFFIPISVSILTNQRKAR